MKYALWISGIPAGLAILCPNLVSLAYFFFIVPGVILTIAPTVFVYLVGTAAVRRMLPITSPIKATAVSFVLVLGFGWLVMQPFRSNALNAYQADCLPDVAADQAIELDGHVLIQATDSQDAPNCDYLCLAVLDLPQVNSVTVVTAGSRKNADQQRSAAYVLEAAKNDDPAGLFPDNPGQIVREFRPLNQAFPGPKLMTAAKAVEADWAMRLAGSSRLRKTDPVSSDAADWVISIDQRGPNKGSTVRRVTVCDSTGDVRFRNSFLKRHVPAAIFYFGCDVFAGGSLSQASFHIGRQHLHAGDRSLHPESELLSAIRFQVPPCDKSSIAQLRLSVKQGLDSSEASDVQLYLARRYLGLFYFDAEQQDYELIARIVSDNRVEGIDQQLMNVFSSKKTPVAMRDAYAERIAMNHTTAELRRWLAEGLTALPPGTFADPTAAHLKIWTSPQLYRDAGAFLSRTADLDKRQALPMLNAALNTAITIPSWSERRSLVGGIREAFVGLGPAASSVAPRISELFLRRPSPLMNNSGDADEWRFALARMGVQVKDLPFFPNQSTSAAQRISRKVAQKLRRYEHKLMADSGQ